MVRLCLSAAAMAVTGATRQPGAMRALPAAVRGMTAFDEAAFDSAVSAPCATVKRHMVGAFRKEQ